jgi:hypothetical protein
MFLIAYANGDPATNPWAALRAEAGNPEQFGRKYNRSEIVTRMPAFSNAVIWGVAVNE